MSYPSLNFALGETIDMLREQVQSFVAAELAPRAAAIDSEFQLTEEWIDLLADRLPASGRALCGARPEGD